MGRLEDALEGLAGMALELFLNLVVWWLMMDLICLLTELLSRLFRGKPHGLLGVSPTYCTIRWILEKRERQEIAERAGSIRPIRRPAPPPERSAAAEVIALRKKVRQRKGGWDEIKYTAGFRLEDGGEVWLSVSEAEFRRLSEGEKGLLTFQGKALRNFQRFGEGASGPS